MNTSMTEQRGPKFEVGPREKLKGVHRRSSPFGPQFRSESMHGRSWGQARRQTEQAHDGGFFCVRETQSIALGGRFRPPRLEKRSGFSRSGHLRPTKQISDSLKSAVLFIWRTLFLSVVLFCRVLYNGHLRQAPACNLRVPRSLALGRAVTGAQQTMIALRSATGLSRSVHAGAYMARSRFSFFIREPS